MGYPNISYKTHSKFPELHYDPLRGMSFQRVAAEPCEPMSPEYYDLITWFNLPLPDYSFAVEPETKERKIDAVLEKLKEGVTRIVESSVFREFLLTMSKFHNYSIGNQILIMLQSPGATRVAGFMTWKDLGRYVKPGGKGIAILAPCLPSRQLKCPLCDQLFTERELRTHLSEFHQRTDILELIRAAKEGGAVEPAPTYFKVVYVFDVKQTEGQPLPAGPEVPTLTGAVNEELFTELLTLDREQGLKVGFELKPDLDPTIKGYYIGKEIWVKGDEPRAQQLKTLIHENAHYYTETIFLIPRADAETIAESSAFVVGAHFGFDSGVSSFPYVAGWAKDKKVLERNLLNIRKVSARMIEALEKEATQVTQSPSTLRENYPEQIASRSILEGKTYRVHIENWGIPRKATAADILRFERDELGNDLSQMGVSEELLKELDNYRNQDIAWVTKKKADAEYYLSEGMTKKDISIIDLPKGSRIIADDQQGGYLVLRGDAKPIIPKAEAGVAGGTNSSLLTERSGLLAEVSSEWRKASEILYAALDSEGYDELDKLLKQGKVGKARFYGSFESWWSNQALSCPKCGSWNVEQVFTEDKIFFFNQCQDCKNHWRPEESPSALKESKREEARYGFLQLNEAEYEEALKSGRYPEPKRYEELTGYYAEPHEPGWKGLSLAEMFPTKYKDLLKRGVPDRLSPFEVKTVIEEKRIPYGRGVERGVSEAVTPEVTIPERVIPGITSEKQLPLRVIEFDDIDGVTKYEVRVLADDRVQVTTIGAHIEGAPVGWGEGTVGMSYKSLNEALASIPKTAKRIEDFIPKMAIPEAEASMPLNLKEPFIKVGERVCSIGRSRYRYETWPKDKWLEAGVTGTVVEYHPEQPAVRVKGEYFEALPPYAVVQWDLGGEARTCIEAEDEGKRWERVTPSTLKEGQIPKTRVSSLGFMELEVPVAMAVEALVKENPWSSGFHSALNQKWAIVFRGKISDRAVKAAEAAGLEVSYREAPVGSGQILTDVSLPGVGASEIERATEAFNKFAELYGKTPSTLKEPINPREKRFVKVGERVRYIGHLIGMEHGVTGTVITYHPADNIRVDIPYATVRWDNGRKTLIDPDKEGTEWERIKEGLDTFSLGKELAAYVPGFKVEVIELPGKSLAFATGMGELDDTKKKILIKLWPEATRQDALAILAHEYSHLQKGTTIIEKGLTEPEVWRRGEALASQWGVLEEYLKLASDLVEYYERTGSYPKITSSIRSWLAKPKARLTEVEDNVEVYTSEILPPEVALNTSLHRDPTVEYRYTAYYYGTDLSLFQRDLQRLLRERTGIPYLVIDTYYIRQSPREKKSSNPLIHEATSFNPDPTSLMPLDVESAFPKGEPSKFSPQEKEYLDRLINEVPDKNDTRAINYWVNWGDKQVYLEGWIDKCLAGTGFLPMESGEWDVKIDYMIALTHKTLIEKQEEKNRGLGTGSGFLTLIEGGFREFDAGSKTWLYGVTWGVYEKEVEK